MHEQSHTIERNGRYYNVYGPLTSTPGKKLKPKYPFEKEHYKSVDEAVGAARRRSEEEGKRGIR